LQFGYNAAVFIRPRVWKEKKGNSGPGMSAFRGWG